jgi:hypothetical protein
VPVLGVIQILSLAFRIYRQAHHPRRLQRKLQVLTVQAPFLDSRLLLCWLLNQSDADATSRCTCKSCCVKPVVVPVSYCPLCKRPFAFFKSLDHLFGNYVMRKTVVSLSVAVCVEQ